MYAVLWKGRNDPEGDSEVVKTPTPIAAPESRLFLSLVTEGGAASLISGVQDDPAQSHKVGTTLERAEEAEPPWG